MNIDKRFIVSRIERIGRPTVDMLLVPQPAPHVVAHLR